MLCRQIVHSLVPCWLFVGGLALNGCGTTRSTDTNRTATEQLLISDAIDRAVEMKGGDPSVLVLPYAVDCVPKIVAR